jgi:hypothetical protein
MLASRLQSISALTSNPHSARCQPVPKTPRLRALALFGRRPAERAESLVIAGVQKPALADLTSTLGLAECVLKNDFVTSEGKKVASSRRDRLSARISRHKVPLE